MLYLGRIVAVDSVGLTAQIDLVNFGANPANVTFPISSGYSPLLVEKMNKQTLVVVEVSVTPIIVAIYDALPLMNSPTA